MTSNALFQVTLESCKFTTAETSGPTTILSWALSAKMRITSRISTFSKLTVINSVSLETLFLSPVDSAAPKEGGKNLFSCGTCEGRAGVIVDSDSSMEGALGMAEALSRKSKVSSWANALDE